MSSFNKFYQLKREINFKHPPADQIESELAAPVLAAESDDAASPAPIKLIVKGQCTFVFKYHPVPSGPATPGIELSFVSAAHQDVFHLSMNAEEVRVLVGDKTVASVKPGILDEKYAYYWLSVDTCNNKLRYGMGEARLETQLLEYGIDKEHLGSFKEVAAIRPNDQVEAMRLLRDPIVDTVPLAVKSMDSTTMDDIAQNKYMPKAALSAMCQRLYETIGGANFVLDSEDFPEFSQAVKYSIETKGCWCYERLLEKATEFGGKNVNEVYLRITLGTNGGESPGIPFVMEIWPPQCYSPVHDHAGANAVIRVLHGQINVSLFPYLRPTITTGAAPPNPEKFPYAQVCFQQGEVTWISAVLNQVHQLRNSAPKGGEPCITIQCYMYDEEDTGHYPYFDYSDDHGAIEQFTPDSDMDFAAFKALMQKEWAGKY